MGYNSLYFNTTGFNNTAFGFVSLQSNTTGQENTAIGYNSLYTNTTGSINIGLGNSSLFYNTTGGNNTAIGYSSMYNNTTGMNNTAIGKQSLYNNTTGYENTAIGLGSLYSNTSGSYSTALGYTSLYSNTTGSYNTALGYQSSYYNTAGSYNTAIGHYSLYFNTTGSQSTAIGYVSLGFNTTGYQNTAIGYASLYTNTTGYLNTANGYASLYTNTTGYYNTALGAWSLYLNTSGYQNTANGYASLYYNTSGRYNTALGYASLYSNSTGSQSTAIGQESLFNNTTAIQNTALGYKSLFSTTSGSYNIGLGVFSLFTNTTGHDNIGIGQESLYLNSTGNYNISIGGYSLSNNTASYNVSIGYQSSNKNTTGNFNVAVGVQALFQNTTGYQNTAVGNSALFTNTTGWYNVAVGADALVYNQTGTSSTAIGWAAGKFISGTTTGASQSSNSVFVGYDTRPQLDNQTNQIVIGYGATGNGSNSATLGADTITKTILRSNVGIGTLAPSTKLHIYSTTTYAFRLEDGTQGVGKVLTSDATGLATWATASGGGSGSSGTSGSSGSSGKSGSSGTSGTSGNANPVQVYNEGSLITASVNSLNFVGAAVNAFITSGDNVEVDITGGGGSSFPYVNVAFVHPNGNDSTAVLGDFTLPFATIEGAFYNSNGLNMTTSPVNNGVIEVWPGESGQMSIDGIDTAGHYSTIVSNSYDYIVQQALFAMSSWKLHLKPGVHIRFSNGDPGDQGLSGGAMFSFTTGRDKKVVTVTSEDSTNSIENIGSFDKSFNAVSSYIANLQQNCELVFENVTIYDSPYNTSGDSGGHLYSSIIMDSYTRLTLRNCNFITTDIFAKEALNQPTARLSNVSMGWTGLKFADGLGAIIETYNSTIGLLNYSDNSGSTADYIHFYTDATYREGNPNRTVQTEIRIRNTRFSNADNNYFNGSSEYSLIHVDGGSIGVWLDNCVVYRGNTTWETVPNIGVRYGTPLVNGTGLAIKIFYASRSVHNYDCGNDPYTGSWDERSGEATSAVSLGVSGYGMFEEFELLRPYDYHPHL